MASSALKALLAVLAVAGFQNRDKIGELLRVFNSRKATELPASNRAGWAACLAA
jgi:hypothetical protein